MDERKNGERKQERKGWREDGRNRRSKGRRGMKTRKEEGMEEGRERKQSSK